MKKDLIYLTAIVVLSFVLLKQCNKIPEGTGKGPENDTLSFVSDTVFMPGRVDTVPFKVVTIVYKEKPAELIHVQADSVGGDSVYTFKTSFTDSMLDAMIISKLKGRKLTTDFKYLPKFPKYIRSVDTLRITNSTVIVKKKVQLYIGGSLGGSSELFSLQPSVLFKVKKGNLYGYGYDIVLKTHNIKGYILIKNPFDK